MIVVELIDSVYWRIVSLGTNPNDYTLTENQKIIIDHNWIFKANGDSYNKDDVIWDDKDNQVILFPEHLKVAQYKKQKLDELSERFSNGGNDISIGEQTLANIVSDIKVAETTQDIDSAFNKITKEKQKFLKRIGL
jgi:hypothetical protein